MKTKLLITILTIALQPTLALAETPRLNEFFYIKTPEELQKMSRKKRENYVMFVIRTHQILQGSMLPDHVYIAPKQNETAHFLKSLFTINEANAIAPLLPIALAQVGRLTAQVAPRLILQRMPTKFMGNAEVVANAGVGAVRVATRRQAGRSAAARSQRGTPQPPKSPAQTNGMSAHNKGMITGSAITAVGSALADAVATAPADSQATAQDPTPMPDLTPIEDQEREGLFCIFGGHSSRYKKVGSLLFCPAPAEMINHPSCNGLNFRPSFKCQSFGLSSATDIRKSKELCISLKNDQGNLEDLTARCARSFEEFYSRASSLDPEKFLEIQNEVLQGITDLENDRGIKKIGLLAYCQENNKVNNNRQEPECKALLELIKTLKPSTPPNKPSTQAPRVQQNSNTGSTQ